MEQRISLNTLGVTDMERLTAFYEALGWSRASSEKGIIAFDLIGQTLSLYSIEKLAEDIGVSVAQMGRGALTFSYNTRKKAEVTPLLARAEATGGRIFRLAFDVFLGGNIGYFADPEGNILEIAYSPHSPLSDDGAFRWNGY
ncbi:VOC family protein [Sulfitobacter guttiformis]|uniref:VOC domain-containing protein n=1 Tax=Sulfitobacter guttiformis TaxID=74349 RepID=A0A420DJX0_9RHOB|nr:VOC family protein [Sulfitobacter guttiformis]KIN71688.1 Glyoxalase/bleomycin resistance protein/dioxygenase [Sulfitobacter guttiformis KCTC 32187]RKE94485.1 hypothetical protein C8N30_3613 [Sulfitobacter guttiformis]